MARIEPLISKNFWMPAEPPKVWVSEKALSLIITLGLKPGSIADWAVATNGKTISIAALIIFDSFCFNVFQKFKNQDSERVPTNGVLVLGFLDLWYLIIYLIYASACGKLWMSESGTIMQRKNVSPRAI